jgi:hypothetical protein
MGASEDPIRASSYTSGLWTILSKRCVLVLMSYWLGLPAPRKSRCYKNPRADRREHDR